MHVVVAIPCYQCENQIARNLRELDTVMSQAPQLQTVILIENRGQDQTVETILRTVPELRHRKKIRLYRNTRNYGLGGSHKIAFELTLQEAGATHLVFLHGDHQATPYDIPALIETSLTNGGVSVLGSRFQDLRRLRGYSVIRTWGNRLLNALYSVFAERQITDLGSGLNLFALEPFRGHEFQTFSNGFTFNMDLLLFMIRRNVLFRYVPINWSTTDQRSNAGALRVGAKTLQTLLRWKLRIERPEPPCLSTERLL